MRSQLRLRNRVGVDSAGQTPDMLGEQTDVELAKRYRAARERGVTPLPTLPGSDSPPVNTVAPSLSGVLAVGSTLTCAPGTWTGTPTPTAAEYRWLRNGFIIHGAISNTYTLTSNDLGARISARVKRSNIYWDTFADTALTSPVPALFNTVAPSISGTPQVGETLTASSGTWVGSPAPTYTYQWRRNGVAINGATTNTYVVVAEDVGQPITVAVTATNTNGSVTAVSQAVTPTS